MKLEVAQRYAAHCRDWLAPFCERIEIAGSVRRERPECADIDLVAIPKLTHGQDLLGATVEGDNLLKKELERYVGTCRPGHSGTETIKPGEHQVGWLKGNGGITTGATVNYLLQLKKCELNVFSATEANFGAVWRTYTGSKEANIWMIGQAKKQGYGLSASRGLLYEAPGGGTPGGGTGPTAYGATEEEIYQRLGLPFIEPRNREVEWLIKNFGEGSAGASPHQGLQRP